MDRGIQTGVSSVDLTLPLPTAWREAGQVETIYLYPLKSARGRAVGAAQVRRNNLRRGVRFVLRRPK